MALIKYGPLATEVAGTVGGVTFARAHDVKTCRTWRAPVNKLTEFQRRIRLATAYFAHYWSNTLSSANRILWNTYAPSCSFTNSLGGSYTISGYNMFIRHAITLNTPTLFVNLYIPACPALNGFGTTHVPTLGFTIANGQLTVSAFNPALVAEDRLNFTVFAFSSSGRTYCTRVPVTHGLILGTDTLPVILYTFPWPLPGAAGQLSAWVEMTYRDYYFRYSLPQLYSQLSG